jgi:hypothetical protein
MPWADREVRLAYLKNYYRTTAEKQKAARRKYYAENKGRIALEMREAMLKRSYGITQYDYDMLLAAQNGVCRICEKTQRKVKNFHVDHCHKTGRVRGLLCTRCNMALGWLEKYEAKAKNYLVTDTTY